MVHSIPGKKEGSTWTVSASQANSQLLLHRKADEKQPGYRNAPFYSIVRIDRIGKGIYCHIKNFLVWCYL